MSGPHSTAQAAGWTHLSDGDVPQPRGLAVDQTGTVYVSQIDRNKGLFRVMKRSPQGAWSPVIEYPDPGPDPGPVNDPKYGAPTGLAVDGAGNVYISAGSRIDRVDPQGKREVIASTGNQVGQVNGLNGLALDAEGNLYVADAGNTRVQKRTPQGVWSVIFVGKIDYPNEEIDRFISVTADRMGQVYIAMGPTPFLKTKRIMKRSKEGKWSAVASYGTEVEQFVGCDNWNCLTTDVENNLYVAEVRAEPRPAEPIYRLKKLDRNGKWTVISPPEMKDPEEVFIPYNVAADRAGNLYVTTTRQVWKYTPSRRGDVDGNAQVDVNDAILTLRHVVGANLLSTDQRTAADVTGEGEVNVEDSVLILRIAVNLE